MVNRFLVVHLLVVSVLLTSSGCGKLQSFVDPSYQPTVQETEAAVADGSTALAGAAFRIGSDSEAPDVDPNGSDEEVEPAPDAKPNPDPKKFTVCPKCKGRGKLFGDGRTQPMCQPCHGVGYIPKRPQAAAEDPAVDSVSSRPPVEPDVSEIQQVAKAISDELKPHFDKLGDRIVGSVDSHPLKMRSYYSDLEYNGERLVSVQAPEALPKDCSPVVQRPANQPAETQPVLLIVALRKDSKEHEDFHLQVLPNLARTWNVRYLFYDDNKKLANNLLPKYLVKSGLDITVVLGKTQTSKLLQIAYPNGIQTPDTAPALEQALEATNTEETTKEESVLE